MSELDSELEQFNGQYENVMPSNKIEKKSFISRIFDKFLNPPDYLLDPKRNIKALIAQDYREILIVDLIILSFLLASIKQTAFVFGKGEITTVAILKAIGLDGAIWALSRSISKNVFSSSIHGFWSKFVLWFGIIIFMFFTTAVNSLYEIWDVDATYGQIKFIISDDPLVRFTQMISSSFLALIIFFLTFVRAILISNMSFSFKELNKTSIEPSSKNTNEFS